MNIKQKIGIMIIISATVILVGSLPFIKGYNPKNGFMLSLSNMKVVFAKGHFIEPPTDANINTMSLEEYLAAKKIQEDNSYYEGRVEMPFSVFMLLNLCAILFGVYKLLFGK